MPSASLLGRLVIGAGALGLAIVATAGESGSAQAVTGQAVTGRNRQVPRAPASVARAWHLSALHATPDRRRHHRRPTSQPASTTAPRIRSMNPVQGAPGWRVTLTGKRFRHITSVRFAGRAAKFTVVSRTEISVVVPARAKSGRITVTGTAGHARSHVFTVTPRQTLEPGETLPSGDSLRAKDHHFTLTMSRGGGLSYLVTGTSHVIWSAPTAGNPGAYLTMLGNGNLVVYTASGARTVWSSGTSGSGSARLVAQTDGNLVVYAGSKAKWASGSRDNKLNSGDRLLPGWFLTSGTGYKLTMDRNGNLVETGPAGKIWSSGTAGHRGAKLIMRASGDLVIRGHSALWTTRTSGHRGARMIDQRSGVIAVRYRDHVLWASTTAHDSGLTVGQWPGKAGPGAAASFYGYPYPHAPACTHGGKCTADKWAFYEGQCTSWVAYRLDQRNGIAFSNYYGSKKRWGNAVNWAAKARSQRIPVTTTPVAGSVAWYGSTKAAPDGHVAYVEKVISAMSVVISEMNYDGDNGFWVHTISPGHDWPQEFIHFPRH
ncbi:MAG TPA: CHAP domain-containing protein [Streptosporangiaceae bacterium]